MRNLRSTSAIFPSRQYRASSFRAGEAEPGTGALAGCRERHRPGSAKIRRGRSAPVPGSRYASPGMTAAAGFMNTPPSFRVAAGEPGTGALAGCRIRRTPDARYNLCHSGAAKPNPEPRGHVPQPDDGCPWLLGSGFSPAAHPGMTRIEAVEPSHPATQRVPAASKHPGSGFSLRDRCASPGMTAAAGFMGKAPSFRVAAGEPGTGVLPPCRTRRTPNALHLCHSGAAKPNPEPRGNRT